MNKIYKATLILLTAATITSCTNVEAPNNKQKIPTEITRETQSDQIEQKTEVEEANFEDELADVDLSKVTVYSKYDEEKDILEIYTIGFNDDKIVDKLNILKTLPFIEINGYKEFLGKPVTEENNKKISKLLGIDEALVIDITPNNTGKELPKDYVRKYTELTILSLSYDGKVKENTKLSEFISILERKKFQKMS